MKIKIKLKMSRNILSFRNNPFYMKKISFPENFTGSVLYFNLFNFQYNDFKFLFNNIQSFNISKQFESNPLFFKDFHNRNKVPFLFVLYLSPN